MSVLWKRSWDQQTCHTELFERRVKPALSKLPSHLQPYFQVDAIVELSVTGPWISACTEEGGNVHLFTSDIDDLMQRCIDHADAEMTRRRRERTGET